MVTTEAGALFFLILTPDMSKIKAPTSVHYADYTRLVQFWKTWTFPSSESFKIVPTCASNPFSMNFSAILTMKPVSMDCQ